MHIGNNSMTYRRCIDPESRCSQHNYHEMDENIIEDRVEFLAFSCTRPRPRASCVKANDNENPVALCGTDHKAGH
jgi:hypothetical protein